MYRACFVSYEFGRKKSHALPAVIAKHENGSADQLETGGTSCLKMLMRSSMWWWQEAARRGA
jgi:hypothetical protein